MLKVLLTLLEYICIIEGSVLVGIRGLSFLPAQRSLS